MHGPSSDLEGERVEDEGRGVDASPPNSDGDAETRNEVMSVCLEPTTVLSTPASTAVESELLEAGPAVVPEKDNQDVLTAPLQNVAKLVLTNTLSSSSCSSAPVLQKVANSSVITVVNATGPLTILKTLCSNSCGTSAPQFTLVNSAPLSVCNAVGKPITVVGAPPITVVRAISNINAPVTQTTTEESTKTTSTLANSVCTVSSVNGSLATVTDRPPIHNVFVKNTTVPPDLIPAVNEVAQVQKLVPANSFLQNNVIQTITTGTVTKTANGQKAITGTTTNNKLKIISNVVVPPMGNFVGGPSSNNNNNNNNTTSNIILNKPAAPKHFVQQQKTIGSSLNGTPKFEAKAPTTVANNFVKAGTSGKNVPPAKSQKLLYPTHKSQIRTIPPVNNSVSKSGIKTLSPQPRGISNQQVQRTSSGLRTIPPQRPPKIPNKPNYIGKHAIQAQKFKNPHGMGKLKSVKPPVPTINMFPNRTPQQNTGVSYHQALTANIIQSLSENSGSGSYSSRGFDFSSRYDSYSESRTTNYTDAYVPPAPKPQSNLEALSFVCQAVLLDHNYNATPPTEPPTRPPPVTNPTPVQLNGASVGSYYSSPNSARNRSSLSGSTNTLSTLSSVSSSSILPSNPSTGMLLQDDDAASDISCGSERKLETEGEETDTAPEAEAVNNDECYEHYGDYVTRCLCGFVHDDGYMIECDKCKVWQHVRCVIKSNKKVPDDYLCEMCDPSKPVDKTKARALQQQFMRENQERDAKMRKEARIRELKLKEALSDSDSSDGEQIGANTLSKNRGVAAGGRRKSDQGPRQNPRQRRDLSRPESVIRRSVKKKERKVAKKKPKPPPKSHSDEETQETWPHSSISQMPQLRQWIEHYEEAVTNHYSPELRARISSIRINGVHSDLSAQMDTSVHKCRIYTQPLTGLKYLASTIYLSPNTPVIELRGKYMLSTQHRGNTVGHGGTLTTRQHAQRPGPFLFFYRLHKDNTEVCVDTRTYGNDARFVRRSCKPTAELRHCIEKGVLHLYIVTVTTVEKNLELTIKHETHDLAAIGTTHIACACGKPDECSVNKGPLKKNGETTEPISTGAVSSGLRKKRGRRTVSSASEQEPVVTQPKPKEEEAPLSPVKVKQEPEIKIEPPDIKEEEAPKIKVEMDIVKQEEIIPPPTITAVEDSEPVKEEDIPESPSPPPAMNTRKSAAQQHLKDSDTEDKKESVLKEPCNSADKRKLSREERKIEAYMKAFERMERQQQRKQEHQAKQAHRRESEPGPMIKDEDKSEPKAKRRRRKGRSRTISTNSQARRNRLNSADSSYLTSGDEFLLSPTDSTGQMSQMSMHVKDRSCENSPSKEAGLLLALASCENSNRSDLKSPIPDVDCNSNSANSSPETPLSSACLLVAAAVEPLEPSFKFPKTKKGLMNEWLNKSPECVQSASSISPSSLTPHIAPPPENHFYEPTSASSFFTPSKNLVALAQAANYCDMPSQPHGNAKKRWLRQAISEDQCDSPTGRPDSPPLSEMVAPPKKRRLPRESLSTDVSPPTTPTNPNAPLNVAGVEESTKRFQEQEDRVEIVTAGADGDSPTQVVIDDATLKERVAEMQQEIGACFRLPEPREAPPKDMPVAPTPLRCVLDPRLSRPMFNNSDHLVATVEKNLSILGFEDQKVDNVAPTKRKLSITEYRQRKQLTVNEKMMEEPASEENTLSQSPPQKLRPRSDSASSATSFMSSDDDISTPELPKKALSAFNSEPTELEKQRESVSLRLKKAFRFSIDEDSCKTALKMETLLSCDLVSTVTPKTSIQRFSPTFPIPGSCSTVAMPTLNPLPPQPSPSEEIPEVLVTECKEEAVNEVRHSVIRHPDEVMEVAEASLVEQPPIEDSLRNREERGIKPEMFYSLDEEDVRKVEEEEPETEVEEVEKSDAYDGVESTNYVPPFNNPVYPNSSFTSFGSVMDDDAPYEGRNPSPPPELSSTSGSYSTP